MASEEDQEIEENYTASMSPRLAKRIKNVLAISGHGIRRSIPPTGYCMKPTSAST